MNLSKRIFALLLALSMVFLVACGGGTKDKAETPKDTPTTESQEKPAEEAGDADALDYTFGVDETFRSDEPISYSSMFSDHEAYPYNSDWQIFEAIKDITNVDLDAEMVFAPRTEYDNQVSLLVNSGSAPYIVPKVYDATAYVASGQVVPISDWVEYMPNFSKTYEDWNMEPDFRPMTQSDGKFYRLPGMWEEAGGGYSYIIRKDIFEAAGVDLSQEADWDYEAFADALRKVKEHTGMTNFWSDQFQGKSSLKIAGIPYGVTGGWAIGNGMNFDHDKEEFYFADASEDFKEYVTYLNTLVNEQILDPETFSQEDETARAKFFRGDSLIINGEYQLLEDYNTKMQVDDFELYLLVQPGGPKGQLQIENSRLENGVIITQRALDELGEEEFIKMLRFVDWLWYAEEGQTLALWGVEGETYTKENGEITLNPDITYMGINSDTATQNLQQDYGFGGGMYAYGGSTDLRLSRYTEGSKEYYKRTVELREPRPLNPPIMSTPEENEELTLIRTPLMDYVETMTLRFITGQEDIESGWDAYVETCMNEYQAQKMVDLSNEIFERTKDVLGY